MRRIRPIRRLLIANRGEIAVRIIRTCRSLGIETVLAVSEADREALPARLADRTVCIGAARPTESYLRVETIVAAALGTGAQAVHPGYGFLAESPRLARACEAAGLIFVGPTAEQLEKTGDKLAARRAAKAVGVRRVPGGACRDTAEARRIADRIGYPLLVKAVAGGGGRGMVRVERSEALERALELASAEARGAFGDPRLYLERWVSPARHIEAQVLGDGEHVLHLGERDCSVQRRHQKLLEEAPAPALDPAVRKRLLEAACRFAASLRYQGIGTVEFLLDGARGEFYFLEMNARIQVEHPVTEAITGVDLVAEQLALAEGHALRISPSSLATNGHAIECRIVAEDPADGFRPVPGTLTKVELPEEPGLRVDTHVASGARIPPYYDSLLAKIIAHGADRAEALSRMRAALRGTRIEGVPTNVALHRALLDEDSFAQGGVDTEFLGRFLRQRFPASTAA